MFLARLVVWDDGGLAWLLGFAFACVLFVCGFQVLRISLTVTTGHYDITSNQVLHLDLTHLSSLQPVIMTLNQFFGYGDRLEAMFYKDMGNYLHLYRDLLGILWRS